MQPRRKKVVVMAAIALGIVTIAFLLPTVIIPVSLSLMHAGSCTDYGCAQSMFDKCNAYQTSGNSTDLLDSMSRGMQGMMCIMGIDSGAKPSAHFSPITLNKV